ncbi:MAG: hypothetical protein VE97_C0005G0016 [candidate division Kazan bacterium GW2011_GWB1_45_10]|uniref:Uncharacterized protein n=1 Tax=candidate division Kazan bacterium GW2011_GWB1_45_10 TaxID=1620411 RepID=A0A0G1KU94_UNCK3|nr:MAG: hypothetical protein VE97_C0005G0016 [candidate division Kazan bacterium GW2011_GWB1_45_10]
MSDQDQNHNLPVEDESTADPVRLPEPIAEAPLLPRACLPLSIVDREGLGVTDSESLLTRREVGVMKER